MTPARLASLCVVAVALAIWFAWPGRVLAQRARVAEFVGVPMARIQPATCLFPGLPVPGHFFRVIGPDGRAMGDIIVSPTGQPRSVSLAIRSGALVEPREPDPLVTVEGVDGLARELIERFWDDAPVPLQRVEYQKDKHGGVKASWRTSGPEVRVYTLTGMPDRYVILERGEPQP
jgi:hypothetical protein